MHQRHVQRHRLLRLQSAHALPAPLGSRAAPPAAAPAGKWPQQPSPPCACYLLHQVCEAWASDFYLEQNRYGRTLFLSLSPYTASGICTRKRLFLKESGQPRHPRLPPAVGFCLPSLVTSRCWLCLGVRRCWGGIFLKNF